MNRHKEAPEARARPDRPESPGPHDGFRRVVRRSEEWVFSPEMPYERQGDVNGVVLPCGWILDQATETIRLYHGGADTCLALATARVSDVLGYLRACPEPNSGITNQR